MEREVEAAISVINSPWGDGTSFKCLTDTWKRSKLFRRASASEVQPIVTIVNNKFGSQTERLNGLKLLQQITRDCSDDILSEYGAAFIQQVVRLCEKHNNTDTRCIALIVIKQLSERAEKFPSMVKSITGSVLSQVVECLNDISVVLKIYACHALYSIMVHFSGSCGFIKANVEQRLAEILTLNDEAVVLAASNCFARMPLSGGGGVAQQGHQGAFVLLQKKTIGSLHLELDALYESINELPMSLPCNKSEHLSLPGVNELKPTVKLQKLEKRIRFLICYLNALLLEPMTIQKGILVPDLLGVVCRALSVTGSSLGKSQLIELQLVRDLIPSVHASFLSIVNSLVSICGTNMLIHQETFYQMMKNALVWTRSKKEQNTNNSFLRQKVYECIKFWVTELKGASGVESFMDVLMPQIVQDITPEKETVVLKAVKQPTKRKRGKAPDKISAEIQTQSAASKIINTDLCLTALGVLDSVIRCAGNLISVAHHKTTQKFVISVLVDLQRGMDPHPLLHSEKCQLQLYEILQTLILFCHPLCPPPTVYAMSLFSTGQTNPSVEIARFCQQAVQIVQRISYPIYPSLVLEPEYSADSEEVPVSVQPEENPMEEEEEEEQEERKSEEEDIVLSDGDSREEITIEETPKTNVAEEEQPDSDLEVLEEIPVSSQYDAASSGEEEEEGQDECEIVPTEENRDPNAEDPDAIDMLAQQASKRARVEIEVAKEPENQTTEGSEEVASMLADFVA